LLLARFGRPRLFTTLGRSFLSQFAGPHVFHGRHLLLLEHGDDRRNAGAFDVQVIDSAHNVGLGFVDHNFGLFLAPDELVAQRRDSYVQGTRIVACYFGLLAGVELFHNVAAIQLGHAEVHIAHKAGIVGIGHRAKVAEMHVQPAPVKLFQLLSADPYFARQPVRMRDNDACDVRIIAKIGKKLIERRPRL